MLWSVQEKWNEAGVVVRGVPAKLLHQPLQSSCQSHLISLPASNLLCKVRVRHSLSLPLIHAEIEPRRYQQSRFSLPTSNLFGVLLVEGAEAPSPSRWCRSCPADLARRSFLVFRNRPLVYSLLHQQADFAAIGSSSTTSNLSKSIKLLPAPASDCHHSVETIYGSRESVKVDSTQLPKTIQWATRNSAIFTYDAHSKILKFE